MDNQKINKQKYSIPKSILVKILQWFYLLLAVLSVIGIFSFKQIPTLSSFGFATELIIAFFITIASYCLLLAFSFFTQNGNLLILSLVSIFFTTIGALLLIIVALPNSQTVISGNLPSCSSRLASCSLQDGIIVASAMLLTAAVPILILNIITIIGAVKAIAATD